MWQGLETRLRQDRRQQNAIEGFPVRTVFSNQLGGPKQEDERSKTRGMWKLMQNIL